MKNPSTVLKDLKHQINVFHPTATEKLKLTKLIVALKVKRNTKKGLLKEEYQKLITNLENQALQLN